MGKFSDRIRKILNQVSTRSKKIVVRTLVICLIAFALLLAFLSPLAKYIVEKYDVQWTGREMKMDWVYVNPFTGYVHISNLRVYESPEDTLFFTVEGVSGNFAMLKFLTDTYELSDLTLDGLQGRVVQDKDHFNFDDIVVKFSGDPLDTLPAKTHFNLRHIKINHSQVVYKERVIPINYALQDLNLESPGIIWDSDSITTTFAFLSQNKKGGMNGLFRMNVKSLAYDISTDVRNFDLEIIRQYLWELINYGMFSAQLDASISARGNFKSSDSIRLQGRISLQDFHLGKTTEDDYAAFKKLVVVIEELSPINKKFLFDSITLERPFFKYEVFDSLNNVEMLFGRRGSNVTDVTSEPGRFNLIIQIGKYLKDLARNFFKSQYQINRFEVANATFKYSDFSLSEQFSINTRSLSIRADSVNKDNKRVGIHIKSAFDPYGTFAVSLSINPRDSADFDMIYEIKKVPATVFNPYLISYTSFPLDRGTLELEGVWNVRNGNVKSLNHLLAIDPRVTKRHKNKDLKWLPLPLIMAFVRERGNVIDYEIPINGNLKDPHFRVRDIVLDLIKNIFVKPVTLPYGIQVKTVENEIENSLTLKWDRRQRVLLPKQKRFVEKMARFLKKNESASIIVRSNPYSEKEKEYILFFEAKKKYFLQLHNKKSSDFTEDDSINVDKMSVKEKSFVHELKKGLSDTVMFTIQEKCLHFVGQNRVDKQYELLKKERRRVFMTFFTENGTDRRVKMRADSAIVPFNGFSAFKIEYQGEIPRHLEKAYEEMDELNNENPRRQYPRGKDLLSEDDLSP